MIGVAHGPAIPPLLLILHLIVGPLPAVPEPPPASQGPPEPTPATAWAWVIPDSTGVLYAPRPEDFRPHHAEDDAVRGRQDWAAYWNWVRVFYNGNLLSAGWTRECRRLLDRIAPGGRRDDLVRRFNVLGRLIAAEWAMDNQVRRLDTGDVRRWGRQLEEAAREGRLERVLAQVEREVDRFYHTIRPESGASLGGNRRWT